MTSKCRVDRILGPTRSEGPGKPAGQPGSVGALGGIRTPNLLIRSQIAGVHGRPCMFGARRLTCGNVLTVSAGVRERPDLLLAKC